MAMRINIAAVSALLLLMLAGCVSLPQFTSRESGAEVQPHVSDITDRLQCEIIEAVDSAKNGDSDLAALAIYKHVVNIDLTLEVTRDESVNPTLSYINPYATAGTSLEADVSGKWSGEQHRLLTQSFTLVFGRGDPSAEKLAQCRSLAKHSGLRGKLGIREILSSGLRYESQSNVYKLGVLGMSKLEPQDPLGGQVAPSFGSTIDFSITYGAGGGPGWTLTHFVGPGGSSLLSFSRMNKDSLQMTFARVQDTGNSGDAERAGNVARDNATRQILQRLVSNGRVQ